MGRHPLAGDSGLIPGSGRSPGEGNGNPLPVSSPGKCHGQRSLRGRSPWVVLKLGSTQQLRTQVFPKTTLKRVCVRVCVCVCISSCPRLSQALWLWLRSLRRPAVSLGVGACECRCVCLCACLWLVCSLRKVEGLAWGQRGGLGSAKGRG